MLRINPGKKRIDLPLKRISPYVDVYTDNIQFQLSKYKKYNK